MLFKKIIGEKCYLSPPSTDDAERWARWANDLEVALPLGSEAHTVFSLEFVEAMIADMLKDQAAFFDIVALEGDVVIGRSGLFNINQVDRNAMFGIFIGEKDYWGQGYGQEATRLTLDYGFNLLNLNSIMLGVFAFNQRAIHAYERVGFKIIGRRRHARIIAGQKFDAVLMDILADEFESPYVRRVLEGV